MKKEFCFFSIYISTFSIHFECSNIILQGYKCEICRLAVHKQCIAHSGRCVPTAPLLTPSPPLPCERALAVKLWFVGEMGRDAASNKLESREDGTYMLRVRPAGQPRLKHETNYALSIK